MESGETVESSFADVAVRLAQRIWERRVHAADGSVTWRMPRQIPPDGAMAWTVPLPDVYKGSAGIAIFFAALARVTGDDEQAGRALAALEPLRRYLAPLAADAQRRKGLRFTIGALDGGASFFYALLRAGELLGDRGLIDEAHRASVLVSAERIEQDRCLDLTTGAAGAILALLALHRARPEANPAGDTPLDLARLCGRHLLASRAATPVGLRAWPWPGDPARPSLTGFGHGAAGIAYALARLDHLDPDPALRAAAAEGLEFERLHFSPEQRGWRDLRYSFPQYLAMWCHGAPGIVLGRLALPAPLGAEPAVAGEIRAGLETTLAAELSPVDHLCCGNMGRAEVLLEAARRLGSAELLAAAHALARQAIDRAGGASEFGYFTERSPEFFNAGFFKGAAGIGYSCLRFWRPDALPCLLLLE